MRYLHKTIFYSLLLIALGWGCVALRANPFSLIANGQIGELLKITYVVVFTSVFWPIAYIELLDYIQSRRGKNGPNYLDYAISLQKDLLVAGLTAVALVSIYWLDSAPYGFSGIDIAFVGFPFLVNALYTLAQSTRLTISGQRVRLRAPLLIFVAVLGFTLIEFWLLIENSSGNLRTDQALFLQLTILFGGLCFFLSTNFMLHSWKLGHFQTSAFKRYFLSQVIASKNSFYSDLDKALEPLNQQLARDRLQQEKAGLCEQPKDAH